MIWLSVPYLHHTAVSLRATWLEYFHCNLSVETKAISRITGCRKHSVLCWNIPAHLLLLWKSYSKHFLASFNLLVSVENVQKQCSWAWRWEMGDGVAERYYMSGLMQCLNVLALNCTNFMVNSARLRRVKINQFQMALKVAIKGKMVVHSLPKTYTEDPLV